MSQTQGLICSVYRNAELGDASNGGLTARFDALTLVGDGVAGVFGPAEHRPAVRLIRRTIGGREYLSAVPMDAVGSGVGRYMFGGNFIYSSDSRFPGGLPIKVHDRVESR